MSKKPEVTVEAREVDPMLEPDGHDLHPVLTNAEFRAAQKKALAAIEAERKADATAQVIKTEKERLALEEGLVVGGEGQKIVPITINLPQFAACLSINVTHKYFHGQTYHVPRHVADSLNEMMDRAWHHEKLEVRGEKLREFYQTPHLTEASAANGIKNAPKSLAGAQI